jgi:hypothetical protein
MLVAIVSDVPSALAGYREDLGVTSIEVAMLPQFCWPQMDVPNLSGPQFFISDCGPAANHYCPGLIYLMRAKGRAAKGKPLGLLQHADVDIRYTEKAIKDYPSCSIRDHVSKSRIEVNSLLRMYGGKPLPPAK